MATGYDLTSRVIAKHRSGPARCARIRPAILLSSRLPSLIHPFMPTIDRLSACRGLNLPQRMERLPFTSYQRKIFLIIATAWLFDGMDLAMMTFILAPIGTAFHLTATESGLLGSSGLAGMAFGAAIAGVLADRFGRKAVFQWSMIVWGAAALVCAAAWSYPALVCARLLLGFGMGAEFPVALSMASEMMPASRRGRYVALLEGMWPISFILAGVVALIVLPVAGWRGTFLVTGLPAIFVLVIRRQLPESPRWYEARGDLGKAETTMQLIEKNVASAYGSELPAPAVGGVADEMHTEASPFGELLSKRYRARTIMIWTVWFFALLGFYGITTWMGKLLVDRGFVVAKSIEWILFMTVWGIPGFCSAAYSVEKFGRKPSMVAYVLLSAAASYSYGQASSQFQLIIAGALMQFFFFGMWSVLYAYTPELFPTRARATACGTASAFGRVGAFLGPLCVPFALARFGSASVFLFAAASFALAALAVLVGGVETKGRILEEISG